MLVPKKWAENGVRRKFSSEIKMPRTSIAREMYQQLRKKEKLKWVLVIGKLKFQGQLIARNDTLLHCFLFKDWLWLMGY